MAAVFLALSLKAFLALEHKTPIIDAAHKALIGSCRTPKCWKKPPTLNLNAESPAAIHRCTGSLRGTLFRIGSVDNYRKRRAAPASSFQSAQNCSQRRGRSCVLWKLLVNSGRKQPPGQICHCRFTHDRMQTRSGSRASADPASRAEG